ALNWKVSPHNSCTRLPASLPVGTPAGVPAGNVTMLRLVPFGPATKIRNDFPPLPAGKLKVALRLFVSTMEKDVAGIETPGLLGSIANTEVTLAVVPSPCLNEAPLMARFCVAAPQSPRVGVAESTTGARLPTLKEAAAARVNAPKALLSPVVKVVVVVRVPAGPSAASGKAVPGKPATGSSVPLTRF